MPTTRLIAGLFAMACLAGCTSVRDYVHNGFKVGPNFTPPPAPVAPQWIDASDARVRSQEADDSHWWTAFNDPILNELVDSAYKQNLSLKEAGFRILANRASLGISIGNIFPQQQAMTGSASQINLSRAVANRQGLPDPYFSQWSTGFGMAWELDFWGRFRRSVEASRAELDASVENYDDVLVTLIGDVADSYVRVRTLQQQIAYARKTLELQKESLSIATAKFKGGQASELDVNQGQGDVSSTEALIEKLQIPLRESMNRLCVLMGMPPEDLLKRLGESPIPVAPPEVVVGVPADLIRRRPDVRKAEYQAAAQCAKIGVAQSELYPHISINGAFGWSSQQMNQLFAGQALTGSVGPSFQWNILNYGRLLNNVKLQDARFQELLANYQSTVLKAGEDVENGLVEYLRAQNRTRFAAEAVKAEAAAFQQVLDQYKNGLVDFNRVVLIQERLVARQLTLAQSQGEIAQGLIHVYRALGGGWQIRCGPKSPPPIPAPEPVKPIEIGTPLPVPMQPVPAAPAPAKLAKPTASKPMPKLDGLVQVGYVKK